jgi:hypothetical protein
LCKIQNLTILKEWVNTSPTTPWGYSIWAGWPVVEGQSLQTCIDNVLTWLGTEDRLIVISRRSELEVLICWLNFGSKLGIDRMMLMLNCSNLNELNLKLQQNLEQRQFIGSTDSRFIELPVSKILQADPQELLLLIPQLGLELTDQEHFKKILQKQRYLQKNVNVDLNNAECINDPIYKSVKII